MDKRLTTKNSNDQRNTSISSVTSSNTFIDYFCEMRPIIVNRLSSYTYLQSKA